MAMIDVNLDEVVEKPRLPENTPFTFAFESAELVQAKNANAKTGERNWMIKGTLHPLEAGWEDRKVWHNWVMSPGSLSSDDPLFSIKKFFQITGFKWGSDGKFDTNDLLNIKFIGTVAHGVYNGKATVNMSKVLKGA